MAANIACPPSPNGNMRPAASMAENIPGEITMAAPISRTSLMPPLVSPGAHSAQRRQTRLSRGQLEIAVHEFARHQPRLERAELFVQRSRLPHRLRNRLTQRSCKRRSAITVADIAREYFRPDRGTAR